MAKFGLNRAEQFGGQGGGGFLSFKHRDIARIRFLYNRASDVEGYSVHNVKLNGKTRYVDCLCGEDGDKSKCPLCKAGLWTEVRFFVPVYDEDTEQVLTWDRGKTFGNRLERLFKRYGTEQPLSATCFKVSREINSEGFPYYTIEPEYSDGATVEEFPEYGQSVYGSLVLLKTAEEMESYLKYGDFFSEDEAC